MVTSRVLLSKNMKRLRGLHRWDQDDLAENAGLSKGMIAQLEQGRKAASPETLDKLVKAFPGATHSDLFFNEATTPPSPQTVAEMPVEDLKAVIRSVSKQDERHAAILAAWDHPKLDEEWRRHVSLFFLTGIPDHLDHPSVPAHLKKGLVTVLGYHGAIPKTRAPKR